MAFNELIKDFSRSREYLRQFYIYGFKTREEFTQKSLRGYDEERRRVESWLGNYLRFDQDRLGRRTFLAVDSADIPANPLYQAFRAKSFTDRDILLHFHLLDMLLDGEMSTRQLSEELARRLADFPDTKQPDDSTLGKKLKEYEGLGLVLGEKKGREKIYRLPEEDIPLDAWAEALAFFSEAAPLGVIGSYLQSRLQPIKNPPFVFKHHYILQALDAQVLHDLLASMQAEAWVLLTLRSQRRERVGERLVLPLRIRHSVQSGRWYLLCYHPRFRFIQYRLDSILTLSQKDGCPDYQDYQDKAVHYQAQLWGSSHGDQEALELVSMVLHVQEHEDFILNRLYREGQGGQVKQEAPGLWRFTTAVYDAGEMLPWLRSFTGRIHSLSSSNPHIARILNEDLLAMQAMYGVNHAVP